MSAVSSSSIGHAEPIWILISSAVRSPIASENSFLTYCRMASSSSSPATRTDWAVTMPPSEITATSVVPPPMSTIMLPLGSCTGRSAPIAAAIGSSMMCTGLRAPAYSAASCTARCSTPVMPDGTQMTIRGLRPLAGVHLLDEVAQHLLADLEVGDHAVLQGPDRLDVVGRATHHPLGLDADRDGAAVVDVDRDDRRLVEHDALSPRT